MNRASPADINPYAAPQVPDAMLVEPECVGAWRDGNRLVVHRRMSALPPICVLTGQPAAHRRSVNVGWSYPIDISPRVLRLEVSVCDSLLATNRRRQWRFALLTLGVFAVSVGVCCAEEILPMSVRGILILALVVAYGFTMAQVFRRLPPLRFKKVHGNYLWLAGAGPKFLDQLQPWPGKH